MPVFKRALLGASLLALSAAGHAADPAPDDAPDVVVKGQRQPATPPVASTAGIDAARIATTVNAANAEDTLKYLPSLIVRKRHIGDTQAPLATRTSGLGSSARSLIYADGVLLSALIGNNNSSASPRWSAVAPEEIAAVDVTYGPFSAAYPGNAIGAVVNITSRTPDRLEATLTAGASVQRFDQYQTHGTFPAYQLGGTVGDRFGPLSLFVAYDHVTSDSQPLTYITANRPAGTSSTGSPTSGGVDTVNRTGAPIRVLGAGALEHQAQDRIKLKAALDLSPTTRLAWTGGVFRNDTDASVETYLTGAASGLPAYAGNLLIDRRAYTVAASAFSSGVYRQDQRHWWQSLSASGGAKRLNWQVIGSTYRFAHDVQRAPGIALPGGFTGGAGTITRLDGTGWSTLDARLAWRSDDAATNTLTLGAHGDRVTLASNRYLTADWLRGGAGAANLVATGHTRTLALWAEDALKLAPTLTATLGGRYEWWRAYDGRNFSASPLIDARQPAREAGRFSPKASLAWHPGGPWTVRVSSARAWRFPTVGELYQIVTTPVPAIPDPNLRPERAWSTEVALEHRDAHGLARVALFDERIRDALVSQSGALAGTTQLATFVQNVAATRARGVEMALDRRDVVRGFDLSGSVTYADAVTAANPAFPASVSKRIPGVPKWKATLVATWRPDDAVALTAAARYASRIWGTLDNSDPVTYTYQGFGSYLVTDVRATVKAGRHYMLGLGVDNLNNRRYFLFHPFPQRTFRADLTWRL